MATGFVTIDFGAFPGSNEADTVITGQEAILPTSKAEAFIMGDDSTGDHTASDHRYVVVLIGFSCGTPVNGVGFTIYARSFEKLQGTYKVRWVWAD